MVPCIQRFFSSRSLLFALCTWSVRFPASSVPAVLSHVNLCSIHTRPHPPLPLARFHIRISGFSGAIFEKIPDLAILAEIDQK